MSGDFAADANWSTGVAPGTLGRTDSDAYLLDGRYTVTLDRDASLRSLSVGRGVTLSVTDAAASLELTGPSSNAGTLVLGSATLRVLDEFLNLGTITASAQDAAVGGGVVVNLGVITTGSGALDVTSDVRNEAGATIRSTGVMGLRDFVTNSGTIVADGGFIRFNPLVANALSNLAGGVLSGGSYAARGEGSIFLYQSAIRQLSGGAEVILDGAGSIISVFDNGVERQVEASLGRIDTGAALRVLGGRDYLGATQLQLSGTLELGGGTFSTGQLNARAGSLIEGFGTVAGRSEVAGTLIATDTLTFATRATIAGAVSGAGTLVIGANASVLAGPTLTVAEVAILGDTRVTVDLAYRGHLTISDAILDFDDHQLRLGGRVDLTDGEFRGGASALLRNGGQLIASGDSRLDAPVLNTGTIAVADGELTVVRSLGGAGRVSIGDGGVLDVAAPATIGAKQLISFAAGEGLLRIAVPAQFHAQLAGFAAGDGIDLPEFSAAGTTLRWVPDRDGEGGTLRLTGSDGAVRLHIADGQYSRADFVLGDDGRGGTLVTGAPDPSGMRPAVFAVADAPGHGPFDMPPEPFHADFRIMLV